MPSAVPPAPAKLRVHEEHLKHAVLRAEKRDRPAALTCRNQMLNAENRLGHIALDALDVLLAQKVVRGAHGALPDAN